MEPQQGDQLSQAAIDDALAATEHLDSIQVTEHVARFEAVHRALSEAMSSAMSDTVTKSTGNGE